MSIRKLTTAAINNRPFALSESILAGSHELSPGAYRLLTRDMPAANLCVEVRPDFYLLPGDPATADLKQLLAELAVDFIIIDAGPSRDLLHALVYHAADKLIIPTTLDFLGLVGVTQQFESIAG